MQQQQKNNFPLICAFVCYPLQVRYTYNYMWVYISEFANVNNCYSFRMYAKYSVGTLPLLESIDRSM